MLKKIISRTLSIVVLLSVLFVVWYLCHLLIYAIPYTYLKPTATAFLFTLVMEYYGNSRSKSRETKDKK